jgi:hypothetical protein
MSRGHLLQYQVQHSGYYFRCRGLPVRGRVFVGTPSDRDGDQTVLRTYQFYCNSVITLANKVSANAQ